jgi:hypothetical protein
MRQSIQALFYNAIPDQEEGDDHVQKAAEPQEQTTQKREATLAQYQTHVRTSVAGMRSGRRVAVLQLRSRVEAPRRDSCNKEAERVNVMEQKGFR